MNNEANKIELELQPVDADDRSDVGFAEPDAAGFSLLPPMKNILAQDDDLAFSLVEKFSFQ